MKISRALISVSDKSGIAKFARVLERQGVDIISTGGTAELLRKEKIPVREISSFTAFPEVLEGRVKTLHPRVHGGLLYKRGNAKHEAEARECGFPEQTAEDRRLLFTFAAVGDALALRRKSSPGRCALRRFRQMLRETSGQGAFV